MNVALDDVSFADTVAGTAGSNATANSIAAVLNSRMNVVKTDKKVGYTNLAANSNKVSDGANNTTLFFNDSSVFQFPGTAAGCTEAAPCKGFIDVNGLKGPNKTVSCSSGADDTCQVASPTDIYPVIFYDQTILPATPAARAVLYGK